SRVQIGGPTGAFIVIVSGIASRYGYDGLATATIMAGAIIILMGLSRFGAMIKFIPYPVTTGFTSGIAVIIFGTQIRDFLGLKITQLPDHFVEQWHCYYENVASWVPATFAVGLGSLAMIIVLRRFAPRVPGMIVAVIVAGCIVTLFDIQGVETIGSKFGGIPRA